MRNPFKRRKGKFDYNFEADKGEFRVVIHAYTKESFFLQAAAAVQRRIGKRVGALTSFEVPKKLYGALGKTVKGDLVQISEQVHSDLPDFKVLTWEIKRVVAERKKGKFFLHIEVSGLCVGD